MTRALRLGLIGVSSIARRRTVPAIRTVGSLAITACAARDLERAKEFAGKLDADAMTYDEILASPDIDAVYVSLPNGLHHEWARRALLAGKHVFCEKPLTTKAAHTDELIALAAERGLTLHENFMFVHHPQHARVRELVDGGRLGELRGFAASFGIPPLPPEDVRYRADLGGGALVDVGVYPLRSARLLLGDGLTVAGATLTIDTGRGVDVGGHVLLVSRSGVSASLEFGFRHSYRSRYRLWGSSAALSLDRAFTPPATRQPVLRIEEQDHVEEISLPPADQFAIAASRFADAALGTGDPALTAELNASTADTAHLVEAVLSKAIRIDESGGRL
ncbi:Gfo/Idh/MocA family oxidoreductase [Amycolatopsis minnesotensis]|uniref:Gfo/Idh/MocA family oxidoreductase n=2 Tax=Amycolatopsis minnesotensis TaxID=337894 RepID=A0ABP5BUA3_9PSEU